MKFHQPYVFLLALAIAKSVYAQKNQRNDNMRRVRRGAPHGNEVSEVSITGGSARASSSHPKPWTPEKAFLLNQGFAWHAGSEPTNPSINARFPTLVWYEFPLHKTFVPYQVSFMPRQDCCQNEAPTAWEFVGSNDQTCSKDGHWTTLCSDGSGAGWAKMNGKWLPKYCQVYHHVRSRFRCLGIRVYATGQGPNGITSLKDVKMWSKTVF